MDFTREPIIETIITPKEGCKLVVRSSKGIAQEEYFVDSVQVVSYGNAFFLRSLERPKAFLVPVSDYEILEVRETRMVLKNVGLERTIKIGGGREPARAVREPAPERVHAMPAVDEPPVKVAAAQSEARQEGRLDKKRDRRRQGRRRRGREERAPESGAVPEIEVEGEATVAEERRELPSGGLSAILPPPSQLISETIHQYRGNELFKDIFSAPREAAPAATPAVDEPFTPEDNQEQSQGG